MNAMNAKTFISILHFDLSANTRQQIQAASAPLFDQERHVARVDITIEGEYSKNTRILYNVTLRAQLLTEVLFEMKQGDKILPAVEAAVATMQKNLCARSSAPTA